MQFTETHEWISAFGAHYALGVDGIGLTLVLLTTLLVPVVILGSWYDADEIGPDGTVVSRAGSYFGGMLAMQEMALILEERRGGKEGIRTGRSRGVSDKEK